MAELDERGIARWRAHAQGLGAARAPDDVEAVRRLLGVQGEVQDQAMWAVAARTGAPDPARSARLFDEGEILRTHVLRSTWHLVARDDLRWLLELTAPRIRPQYRRAQAEEGITDAVLERALGIVEQELAGGVHLTRDELGERLAGLVPKGRPMAVLLAQAELDGLVCSGARHGRQHTYARLAERVPDAPSLDRDEALAQLAQRYFTGHGPATERDLAYWATLTLADVRAGLQAAGDRLQRFELAGRTYWAGTDAPAPGWRPGAHLLHLFDELYRGYQDSRWALDADRLLPRARETILGLALDDGQAIGRVRRHLGPSELRFEVHPLRPWTDEERRRIDDEAARYGRFVGLPAVVEVIRRADAGRVEHAGRHESSGGAVMAGDQVDERPAAARIDAIIEGIGDWRGDTLRRLRERILAADPDVVEEIKWVKPTNPDGVPTWSHDGILCTGEVYKDKVKLTFAHGAALDDPAGLFNASLGGGTRRAIDLREGEDVDPAAFEELIRSAVERNASRAG